MKMMMVVVVVVMMVVVMTTMMSGGIGMHQNSFFPKSPIHKPWNLDNPSHVQQRNTARTCQWRLHELCSAGRHTGSLMVVVMQRSFGRNGSVTYLDAHYDEGERN